MLLNGQPIKLKGVSYHEDDPLLGAAWKAPQRAAVLARIDQLGANVIRAHYPLHPAILEAMDRRGVLVWDQAPIYQVQNDRWELPSVRRNAVALNAEVVRRDRGHPSVMAYSMANELPDPITPAQRDFVAPRPRGRSGGWTRPGSWPSTAWRASGRCPTPTRSGAASTRWA